MKSSLFPADGRVFSQASRRLLDLAQALAPDIVTERTLAIAVGGSVARGDAEPGSDLDLLVFAQDGDGAEIESRIDGTNVAMLMCAPDYPFCLLREGTAVLWLFREIARVRAAIPVWDPAGFFAELQARARRTRLPSSFQRDCLERARAQNAWTAQCIAGEKRLALIGLRASLMVALTPALHAPDLPSHAYYSKPKYETAVIAALPDATHRALYDRFHDLIRFDAAAIGRRSDALEALLARIIPAGTQQDDDVVEVVWRRVVDFLGDARNRLTRGLPRAAAAPLQYAAFELAWLAAYRRGDPFTWVPDAMASLEESGVLDVFFTAAGADVPPGAEELFARVAALDTLIDLESAALRERD